MKGTLGWFEGRRVDGLMEGLWVGGLGVWMQGLLDIYADVCVVVFSNVRTTSAVRTID